MRLAILASPKGIHCFSTGRAEDMAVILSDRIANGEAFTGERVVRLPRRVRMVRRIYYGSRKSDTLLKRWTPGRLYPLRRFIRDSV